MEVVVIRREDGVVEVHAERDRLTFTSIPRPEEVGCALWAPAYKTVPDFPYMPRGLLSNEEMHAITQSSVNITTERYLRGNLMDRTSFAIKPKGNGFTSMRVKAQGDDILVCNLFGDLDFNVPIVGQDVLLSEEAWVWVMDAQMVREHGFIVITL